MLPKWTTDKQFPPSAEERKKNTLTINILFIVFVVFLLFTFAFLSLIFIYANISFLKSWMHARASLDNILANVFPTLTAEKFLPISGTDTSSNSTVHDPAANYSHQAEHLTFEKETDRDVNSSEYELISPSVNKSSKDLGSSEATESSTLAPHHITEPAVSRSTSTKLSVTTNDYHSSTKDTYWLTYTHSNWPLYTQRDIPVMYIEGNIGRLPEARRDLTPFRETVVRYPISVNLDSPGFGDYITGPSSREGQSTYYVEYPFRSHDSYSPVPQYSGGQEKLQFDYGTLGNDLTDIREIMRRQKRQSDGSGDSSLDGRVRGGFESEGSGSGDTSESPSGGESTTTKSQDELCSTVSTTTIPGSTTTGTTSTSSQENNISANLERIVKINTSKAQLPSGTEIFEAEKYVLVKIPVDSPWNTSISREITSPFIMNAWSVVYKQLRYLKRGVPFSPSSPGEEPYRSAIGRGLEMSEDLSLENIKQAESSLSDIQLKDMRAAIRDTRRKLREMLELDMSYEVAKDRLRTVPDKVIIKHRNTTDTVIIPSSVNITEALNSVQNSSDIHLWRKMFRACIKDRASIRKELKSAVASAFYLRIVSMKRRLEKRQDGKQKHKKNSTVNVSLNQKKNTTKIKGHLY